MDGPTIAQLTTVAGLTTATWLLSELWWRTVLIDDADPAARKIPGLTKEFKTRFGPILAVVFGVVVGIGAGSLLGQGRLDIWQAAVNGVFGGLSAMGVQNLVSSRGGITAGG